MPDLPVLSVDTSYDVASDWFAGGRREVYDKLGGQFEVVQLGVVAAERTRVLRILQRADDEQKPFRAVLISSHGAPSKVFDDDSPEGILLSDDRPDEELVVWARGRVLYFCTCETAQGPLFGKLLGLGATTVLGFTQKPSWQSDEGRRLWREFDQEIVRCVIHRQGLGAFTRVKNHFVDRIDCGIPFVSDLYRADLMNMKQTLTTMVVQG